MPDLIQRVLSWKWTPVWAVPLLVVWPALIAHAVFVADTDRSDLLRGGLFASAIVALPFLGLALVSSVRRTRPFVIRGAALGGMVAAGLAWWPYIDYVVDDIRGETQGFEGIGVAWMIMASPLVVAVGMSVGVLVSRQRGTAG